MKLADWEKIKEVCKKCPDEDCPFDVCYFPHREKGIDEEKKKELLKE